MVTTAGFLCSAQRFGWAAAIRSQAVGGRSRFFGFISLELETPEEPKAAIVVDCAISSDKLKTRNFCLEGSNDPFSIHASSTYHLAGDEPPRKSTSLPQAQAFVSRGGF
jgi:hypothetical protein